MKPHFYSGQDVTDFPPNNYVFRVRDGIFLVIGIITYITDWVFDVYTAYKHWVHKDKIWLSLSIFFVVFPSLAVTVFTSIWYLEDHKKEKREDGKLKCVLRTTLVGLQLGLTIRYAEGLYHGILSRLAWKKGEEALQKQLYVLMLYEESDCILLRLIESFLEAIPQLILQLYILVLLRPDEYGTFWIYILWMNCLTSLVSVSWGMTAFHRGNRFTHPTKENISLLGSSVIFLWQMFTIGSRVLAILLFVSFFHEWILAMFVPHWAMVFTFLYFTDSFKDSTWRAFICAVLAAVFFFVFINDKDEPTRNKYTIFYSVCFFENLAMVTLWAVYVDPTLWYFIPGLVCYFVFFTCGLAVMVLYYKCLHPSVGIVYVHRYPAAFQSEVNCNPAVPSDGNHLKDTSQHEVLKPVDGVTPAHFTAVDCDTISQEAL